MGVIQKILNIFSKNNLKGNIDISIPELDTLIEYNRNEIYQRIITLFNEIFFSKVNAKIDKVNELSIVMNQTIDRDVFYASADEIENILTELSQIEQNLNLSQPPSEHLKRFRLLKNKQISLLEKRISDELNSHLSSDIPKEDNDLQVSEIFQEELSAIEAYEMLEKANKLSDIANKTNDRDEFFESIEEIKEILSKLSEYEGKIPFIGSPSDNLKKLEQIEKSQIKLLEKRIAKKEHHAPPKKIKMHETNKKIKRTAELEDITSKTRGFKYFFPSTSLLNKNNNTGQSLEKIKQRALKLIQTLTIFGIDADIVDIAFGSRFTRYEIQIGKGVRIKDVLSIKDDIKLILETTNLHIEAPIAGRTTIGIDAENDEFSMVTLREIIESDKFMNFSSNLALAIGKDIAGNIVTESLDNMCHLLIGGTIGSGKSVCISSIIMSILYKAPPNDVKLLLIDTKAVNLTMYNGIPHLLIPVLTDLRKSTVALQWAVNEMMERYGKFGASGVRDLAGYNKVAEKYYPNDKSLQKIPRIVIIIDDFSDLMNGSAEESICRLAQMGRAAGMHLIISTQRPSVDVITGIIKANIPSRIAFKVFSSIDSRTILDAKGAEDLFADGDMLFYPQGARMPIRVQGVYVSDEEISNVLDFLKIQAINNLPYQNHIENKIKTTSANENTTDIYFAEAGKFAIEKDTVSIGMLQRVFKIGFRRTKSTQNTYGHRTV